MKRFLYLPLAALAAFAAACYDTAQITEPETAASPLFGVSAGPASGGPFAFVVNRSDRDGSVRVVNTETRELGEELVVGGTLAGFSTRPKSLAITPDGQFLYVTVGQGKEIAVVGLEDLPAIFEDETFNVPSGPQSIAITPDGQFAYVSTRFTGAEVYRLSDNTLFQTITSDFFDTVQEVAITPSGSHVYFANVASNGRPNRSFENVTVVETATNTVVAVVDVSGLVASFGPWGVTALPDGKKVYTNDGDNGNFVFEIDSDPSSATFNQVTGVIDIRNGTEGPGPRGMDSGETPLGVRVYAALSESNEVVVIDPATNLVVDHVYTGAGTWPIRVRLNPDGTELWVALREAHEVVILDTGDNTEIARIDFFPGFFPNDIAFLPSVGALEVDIDIKPGSDPNSINLKSKGRIPVAILTTDDFDAADVDPASVTLGDDDGSDTPVAARKNGTLFASLDDVDDDGDLDLILHFDTQALVDNGDLDANTTELVLNGETTGGQAIQGSDSGNIVP